MLSKLKMAYDYLPKHKMAFIKHIPDSLLFGSSYANTKVSFDFSELNIRLLNTLNFSRENTVFGSEHIPRRTHLSEVFSIVESMPLIGSNDISENLDYFSTKAYSNKSYLTTTGGTGRNPTSIVLSNESFGIEWAHMHHIWSLNKYSRKRDLKLTLRGKHLKGKRLVEFNPVYNELVVDTFKLSSSNFGKLIDLLEGYSISCVHGYPSLLKEFMSYCQEFSYRPRFRSIFLGSEGATSLEKHNLELFFGAKVIHWYGQTEKVTLGVDDGSTGDFRVYTSYGFPRTVNGEIVATSFVNKALPLINYRTGDSGTLQKKGDSLFISNLKGRWGKDFIYLNENKKIPTASINFHSDVQSNVLFYQIEQSQYGKILVKVLLSQKVKSKQEKILNQLYTELKSKLAKFDIEVKSVDENNIERSARGKMMMLVQKIDGLSGNEIK